MLKLTLPEKNKFLSRDIEARKNFESRALSGGYPQKLANAKLHDNHGIIASFSRALTEGLSAGMSDQLFSDKLELAINDIYAASIT